MQRLPLLYVSAALTLILLLPVGSADPVDDLVEDVGQTAEGLVEELFDALEPLGPVQQLVGEQLNQWEYDFDPYQCQEEVTLVHIEDEPFPEGVGWADVWIYNGTSPGTCVGAGVYIDPIGFVCPADSPQGYQIGPVGAGGTPYCSGLYVYVLVP